MRFFSIVAALAATASIALQQSAFAQSQTNIEKVVGARLMVSEFIRICVRTGADTEEIEAMALAETWIPDAPSSIQFGLNREADQQTPVYTFTRSRSTSDGRIRSDFQVLVPADGVRDCTMEFENVDFDLAAQSLVASGFTEAVEGATVPDGAPARMRRGKYCEPERSYAAGDCVELSVDPAAYPLTGQLTYLPEGKRTLGDIAPGE